MSAYIFNFHDVILFLTMVECIMLALFQWTLPGGQKLAGRFLIGFLLVTSLNALSVLIFWNDHLHIGPFVDQYIVPYMILFAALAKGPLLYFYILSLTREDVTFKRASSLHLLPLIIAALILLVFSVTSSDLRWETAQPSTARYILVHGLWLTAKASPLFYGAACVWLVKHYYRQLKQQYSAIPQSEPVWLSILSSGFFLTWAFSMAVHIAAQFVAIESANYLGISENYVIFLFINGLFAYSAAFAHRVLTTRMPSEPATASEALNEDAVRKVQEGMETRKLFLQHALNIEQFANHVELTPREVSAVINKHFDTNFFEFMNSYRVEEAKRLLASEEHKHMTVMDILLESGFNSKSAFHRFFKRLTGLSPSEFRKQQSKKEN